VGGDASDAKNELLELDDPASLESTEESPVSAKGPSTIVPKFDPSAFAEESEIRERMPTLTDEALLEEARLASMPSSPPTRPQVTGPFDTGVFEVPDSPDSATELDVEEVELVLEDDGVPLSAGSEAAQIAAMRERLQPLYRVPTLTRPLTELGGLLEDPKTAYVLGFVDGILPLETIIDVTGLPEYDTLRVLDRMVVQGVMVFRPARPFRKTGEG
jgi:hypothetical protein